MDLYNQEIISVEDLIDIMNKFNNNIGKKYTTHDYIFGFAIIIKMQDYSNMKLKTITPEYVLDKYQVDAVKKKITMHNKVDKGFNVFKSIFFAGHFVHFESGINFLGQSRNTALTNFKKNTKKACYYRDLLYKHMDNKKISRRKVKLEKRFLKYLANSCHYLADMNAPHHISNSIGPKVFNIKKVPLVKNASLSNHKRFERLARGILDGSRDIGQLSNNKYSINDFDLDSCYKEYLRLKGIEELNKNIEEVCDYLANESIIHTQGYLDEALSIEVNDNIIAIIECIKKATVEMALLLDCILEEKI